MPPVKIGKKMPAAKIAMIAMVLALVIVPGVKLLSPSHAATPETTTTNATAAAGQGSTAATDDRVNAVDLSILMTHDGQDYAQADLNGDGTVGSADLAILLARWTW